MKTEDAVVGNLVRVNSLLTTTGMMVAPKYLKNRRSPARGLIVSVNAPSGGPTLVWVHHRGVSAPYWTSELALMGVKA